MRETFNAIGAGVCVCVCVCVGGGDGLGESGRLARHFQGWHPPTHFARGQAMDIG